MPDPVELHDRGLDATAAVVARVRPDQFGLPTPCAAWDVRGVLGHLVEANRMFTAAAGTEPVDVPDDDPLKAYEVSTADVRRAWRRPGLVDEEVALPFGSFPGRVAVRMHFVDHFVHGWDLAVATGQDAVLDPELAGVAFAEMSEALVDAPRGPRFPFGPVVDWPDDAPVHERLVALLGRRPPGG